MAHVERRQRVIFGSPGSLRTGHPEGVLEVDPTLELLLPLAQVHQVPLDQLVGAPETEDPRVRAKPIIHDGMTTMPPTRQPGRLQAFRQLIPGDRDRQPDPRVHEGYEWLYVLTGRLRLVLGQHDLVLVPGEAAEFDTRVPHWFGTADGEPVEFLAIFGRQGERVHLRVGPRSKQPERRR